MANSFIAYIDESGDDGIRNLRAIGKAGSCHWLVIGCCLIDAQNDTLLPAWRDEISSAFVSKRRQIHFSQLNHDQRIFACEKIKDMRIIIFIVMSKKKTIQTHPRADLFKTKNTLYWYLARYLVERLSWYSKRRAPKLDHGDGTCKLVFSKRGGMEYQDFRNYLAHLRENHETSINWKHIDIGAVQTYDHSKRAGLQLADAAASAFSKAVEPNPYGGYEPRYAKTLLPRIAMTPEGKFLNYGIKPVPRIDDMPIDTEQRAFFEWIIENGRAGPRPLYHRPS